MSILLGILFLAIIVVIWWKIFDKAGMSAPLSILMFIPLVNLILLFYFAFSEWPILKEVKSLRLKVAELEADSIGKSNV